MQVFAQLDDEFFVMVAGTARAENDEKKKLQQYLQLHVSTHSHTREFARILEIESEFTIIIHW